MTDIYINSVTFFAEFLITMTILLNGYSFKKNIVKSALWGLLAYAVALLIYFLFSNIYLNIATTFVINLFFSYFVGLSMMCYKIRKLRRNVSMP
jgi:high-affinity Fe2+/Pb2+ permease